MNANTRYGFWLRSLHWLVAALVIGALALVELHEFAPRGSALRNGMMYWHTQFGIAVLLLFLPRALVRLAGRRPAVVPPLPVWQKALSVLVQAALYLLMLAQPLLGVLMVQAHGHDVAFLGLPIPRMVAEGKDLGHQLGEWHETLGNVFLWLAVVHAVAALWHHWGRRDNTLRRMGYGRA